ncbi:discoidin domain-containing protein [Reichenbachiella carrageenanivorans]|uniref:alpha-L-fucosidase n=1 Tax=Reichenbachiella carrageenanivorans TaxID=2979869 RepID=A0ABY6D0V4_9BACT|nr:discoidin domain-containing protein [Reichenbachiella carrageenanivorans]UXX79802.1 discoidin domain-containing protein [Reichenbachiella carrageenanivorans]
MKTKFIILSILISLISFSETFSQEIPWVSQKFGVFVHYGWGNVPGADSGFPITQYQDGSYPQSVDEVADAFDVDQFVDAMDEIGPEYVIFTAWHGGMFPLYPSQKMDEWVGPGHCSQRDLIGEVMDGLIAKGIQIILYTQPNEAKNFSDEDKDDVGYDGTNNVTFNNFINDVYAEMIDRYGTKISGMWFDSGSRKVETDKARLRETVLSRLPNCAMISINEANEVTDFGAAEIRRPHLFNSKEGFGDINANDAETWPGLDKSVANVTDQYWWSVPGTYGHSAVEMYKYTIMQAATCEEGGGTSWSFGPYPGGQMWNGDLMTRMSDLGAMVRAVGESIKGTHPSTSYLSPHGTRINELEWGAATQSADGNYEYLHILKPPSGSTLTISAPDDGKEFSSAVNLLTGNAVSLVQTSSQVSLTLSSGDSWDLINTVIKLTVGGTPPPNDDNIALGKIATQSSTGWGGLASRAIDGSTDGNYNNGSVTHTTGNEVNPWWEVDLGSEYSIGDINIYGRTDACCAARLSDYTVSVINAADATVFSQDLTEYPTSIINAGNVMGQVIRIQLNTSDLALSLAEVQVFEGDDSSVSVTGVSVSPSSASITVGGTQQLSATVIPSNATNQNVTWSTSNGSVATVNSNGLVSAQGVGSATITATTQDGGHTDATAITVTSGGSSNLALNGTATQSSTDYNGVASRAIDDNTNGAWGGGSVTHTANSSNPWWEVDLGAEYSIGDINIFGRTGNTASRLSDYTVSVINSSGVTTFSQDFTEYPTASTNAGNVQGQIIRVQLNYTEALSLAEVQVFGTSAGARLSGTAEQPIIAEDSGNNFQVYPNPVEGRMTIKLEKAEYGNYALYNINGRVVLSDVIDTKATEIKLDLEKFDKGVYVLMLNGSQTIETMKVIKN